MYADFLDCWRTILVHVERGPTRRSPYVQFLVPSDVCKGKVPKRALANNLWIGEVPEVLSQLSFVERILVARVHHSCCFVRVAVAGHPGLGARKMISHVVAFESPVSKVYDVLPPPREELDKVLAVMFTGPTLPTKEEIGHTPLLVRHKVVVDALQWLLLNHCDYSHVSISQENLATYVDGQAPVAIIYKDKLSNKVPEGTSEFDDAEADGTTKGPCPIVVHGLVGEQLETLSITEQKAKAARHFKANNGVLAIGHAVEPQSIYNNTSLYPSMFPWLFPYGYSGLGHSDLSDIAHKRWLLMYHDKRFQTDIAFPFIAFSHEQIKASTTGGFLLTDKDKFHEITDRIHRIDENVLASISERMTSGETVIPATDAEKDCFQLINDIDHVAHRVQGSLTSKKYMRNEIESDPIPLGEREHVRLVTGNPMACAWFFHFMVELFILYVLRVRRDTVKGQAHSSFAHYYMDQEQSQSTAVRYLESIHKGEYLTGTQEAVSSMRHQESLHADYIEVTEVLPEAPPPHCDAGPSCPDCESGNTTQSWWGYFKQLVDIVINKCNVHTCVSNTWPNGMLKRNTNAKGCLDNKWGKCKACFPCKLFAATTIDPETGHIHLMKKEQWINTFGALLSYIFRCNTNLTSLRSGMAIKAVLIYVTDYITKPGLKTHAIFDCICSMFQRSKEHPDDPLKTRKDRTRKLMTQMVNVLRAKTELGSPMICSYLLGFPDHYTNKRFSTFYWKLFVAEASNYWRSNKCSAESVKITLKKRKGAIMGISPVEDYIHRPVDLEHLPLYEWICTCSRIDSSDDEPDLYKCGYDVCEDDTASVASNASRATGDAGSIRDFIDDADIDDDADANVTSLLDDMAAHVAVCVPYVHTDTEEEEIVAIPVTSRSMKPLSKKRKGRKKYQRFRFTELHPLADTHHIRVCPVSECHVPNFVGGMLPRKDKGDREYYCLVMLTFFRPWRSGKDLKSDVDTTWDCEFGRYMFLPFHSNIIANFNLRYECLDARDDFRAEMMQDIGTDLPTWLQDDRDDLDALAWEGDQVTVAEDFADFRVDGDEVHHPVTLGRRQKAREMQTAAVRALVGPSGCNWTVAVPGSADTTSIHTNVDISPRTTKAWNEEVARLQQAVLQDRHAGGKATPSRHNKKTDSRYIEQVKVVHQSHLVQSLHDESDEAIMSSVTDHFLLNPEQE
ncbi:hypothetical protein IW262DRAFT_1299592 [Armillaria fumosa]|nr:hypothetical protein IW262DRAFT_1299592 [Armillaria fumosa]